MGEGLPWGRLPDLQFRGAPSHGEEVAGDITCLWRGYSVVFGKLNQFSLITNELDLVRSGMRR